MLRILAVLFGIGFIFAGVAGFFPSFMPNGLLFGFFKVDVMHNVVHIVSGVLAIMAATRQRYARLYFQIFGIFYAVVTIVGFSRQGNLDFLMMQLNMADNFLHLFIAIAALYLGFFTKKSEG